jgi:hypothetical protein
MRSRATFKGEVMEREITRRAGVSALPEAEDLRPTPRWTGGERSGEVLAEKRERDS